MKRNAGHYVSGGYTPPAFGLPGALVGGRMKNPGATGRGFLLLDGVSA